MNEETALDLFQELKDDKTYSDSKDGYRIRAWDYQKGWLVGVSFGVGPERGIWADGLTSFHDVPTTLLGGQKTIEITPNSIELPQQERKVILDMLWEWEWQSAARDGTCLIQCVEKATDLTGNQLLEMFKREYRNPSATGDTIEVLEKNGYRVIKYAAIGYCPGVRRIVTMKRIGATPETSGHAVLVYEDEETVFDPDGLFKKLEHFICARGWGYELGEVLVIEKLDPTEQPASGASSQPEYTS